jgi:hypothetical protein
MIILVTGFSIQSQATFGGRVRSGVFEGHIDADIEIICTPVQLQAEPSYMIVNYPNDSVFLVGFLLWLAHRHRCGQYSIPPTTFDYQHRHNGHLDEVRNYIIGHLGASPQERIIQFATFLRRQGNTKYKARSYEAAIDLYESALLILSEWEREMSASSKRKWTDSSLACVSNILQARIVLNQHSAALGLTRYCLSLATLPGNSSARQRTKLLYRCALVAEASGSLRFASTMLLFASALGSGPGDLLREIHTLQASLCERLLSISPPQPTSYSTSSIFHSRLRRRTALVDESTECSICLTPISNQVIGLPCDHEYHAACINTWLEYVDTCPLCRAKFGDDRHVPETR